VAKGVDAPAKGRTGSVQSIERAFGLLEAIAGHGGMMGLSQLVAESGLPPPTIHRLVRTLVDLGYLRQEPSRRYVLAPKLIQLGESSSRMLAVWARPHLERLVGYGAGAFAPANGVARHPAAPCATLASWQSTNR
jgi:IclR family acetate operon transcriptional repressor